MLALGVVGQAARAPSTKAGLHPGFVSAFVGHQR
jgi:hypothetical protein